MIDIEYVQNVKVLYLFYPERLDRRLRLDTTYNDSVIYVAFSERVKNLDAFGENCYTTTSPQD